MDKQNYIDMAFERRDRESGEWEPIETEYALKAIGVNYKNVKLAVDYHLEYGDPIRCTFADYRVSQ